ncbi:hypothetical protein ABIB57_004814 [Devosia sp. UYZn731]
MQVNVLISDDAGPRAWLLVLPFGEANIVPTEISRFHWRDLATALTDDRLLRTNRSRIEAELECRGYSLIAA